MARIKTKELNKPDAFQERITSIFNYLRENRKKIYISGGIAAGIVLIALGWYLYRMDYEKSAQKMYALAFDSYHFAQPGSGDEAHVMRSVGMYREVIEKYPGSRAAALSHLSLGNIYYKMNDFDRSIQSYQAYLGSSTEKGDLKALAYSGLGYAFEAKGQLEKALETYDNASRNSMGSAFSGMIYSNMARIYEKMKDHKKSLEYYKRALEQRNEPLLDTVVKRKIAELES